MIPEMTKDQRPQTTDLFGWRTRLGSLVFSPWSLVLVCTVLLFLRKPWALHTPQFWAEDGEIFMKQDDSWGTRAILVPYNGYLHLIPRLIAWIASRTADVAWWPAIYNGLAFAISVGLFARMASPRVVLPGKPWLMLALVAVVGTGEVLINVTNLQWVTAFFLLLQLFIARPTTVGQRLGDAAILFIVGLNGPFAIVFLPLFAWRAWREWRPAQIEDPPDATRRAPPRGDATLALAVLAMCAIAQAVFVARAGLSLPGSAPQPFQPLMFLSVIGSRLVIWPILGPSPVKAWPPGVHALLGAMLIVPLLLWSLRAGPWRSMRAMLVAAFRLTPGQTTV